MTATTLASLAQAFERRESSFLPDTDAKLSRLRVTPTGTLDVPSVGEAALTEWSAAQFARLLGFQERYFERAAPDERAAELNRRLARSDRSVRLRVARQTDGTHVLRGLLGAHYTSIADSIVVRAILDVLGPNLPVVWSAVTDRSSTVVIKVGDTYRSGEAKKVGDIWGTLTVRNSDVGYACLWGSLSLFRLVCTNGMALPDGQAVVISRRHVGLDEASIRTTFRERLIDLPGRINRGIGVLERATEVQVTDVEAEVRAVLRVARLPLRLTAPVLTAYGQEPSSTAFGISQAITRAAQALTPEERLQAEMAAGRYVQQAVFEARQA